ncbi:hypothetical protein CAPTEDRAFT_65092, partial [Capitella teleta]
EEIPNLVALNVGGYRYMTRLSTLCKYQDSMLASMFSGRHRLDKDSQGYYFIDSNGSMFVHILEYLRNDTLPPNNLAAAVYKDACYYNIYPLMEELQLTPAVAQMVVKDNRREQFPDYFEVKKKVIRTAIAKAVTNHVGAVFIHAFREKIEPKAPYFNAQHVCVVSKANVVIGPWESPADKESFIRCLEDDLITEGF